MLIDEGDVEGALQNTLVAVTRGIGSFEGKSRFTTWLYRIAEREALQVLRKNKRVTTPDGADFSGLAEEVRRMSSIVASRAMITQALDELDPKFREPVMMCDVEGLDYARSPNGSASRSTPSEPHQPWPAVHRRPDPGAVPQRRLARVTMAARSADRTLA
ncbi:MAG: RNA polymerase sigma factor [Ilumatobacteraceae bacterium]